MAGRKNRSAFAGVALGLAAGASATEVMTATQEAVSEPIWRYPPKTLPLAGVYEAIAER